MPRQKSSKRSAPVASGEFLTCDEVARELHISTKTLQRRIDAGQFCPFLRVGRKMLWRRARLEQWFAEHESVTGVAIEKRTRRRMAPLPSAFVN